MAAAALALLGCTEDPSRLDWVVSYGSPDLAGTTAVVRVQLREGGCDGDGEILYESEVSAGSGGAAAPGEIGAGEHSFRAEAVDIDCEIIAAGCETVTLPTDGEVVVVLTAGAGGSACGEGEECNGSGRCRSTMPETDAGPEPCATDGETCGGGAGVCRGGFCCTGCWTGSDCRAGGSVDACGASGDSCAECGTGNQCAGGTCTSAADAAQLSLNAEHSIFRLADGRLYGAGSNSFSQQGPGAMPGAPEWSAIDTGSLRFARVATSQFTTCGITQSDGELYCWGTNTGGSLARNEATMVVEMAPVAALTDPGWVDLAAGDQHLCGIRDDGSLWCWGLGSLGQLGNGGTAPAGLPAQVMAGSRWGRVSALKDHTCAIRDDGTLWCWGLNADAQLGLPNTGPATCSIGTTDFSCATTPQQVGVDADWIDVSAGVAHTCGIRAGGTLWCFGRGEFGELGVVMGGQEDQVTPQRVGDAGWMDVAAGEFHTCALTERSGELRARCWGVAIQGATGTGSTSTVWTPTPTVDDSGYASIEAGWKHTCAVRDDLVTCWGDNDARQLGSGVADDALEPVAGVLVPEP